MTPTLIIAGALIVSLLGGWGFTAGVLTAAARSERGRRRPAPRPRRRTTRSRPGRPERPRTLAASGAPTRAAPLRGGLAIGLLERAAVTLALVAGQPDAVAVVVAVKGLGRFSELRDNPDASERFVIGSLASLLWAGVVGALARALLT
ncbi:MAG: hypothetical protein L6311_08015 [Cellulomonas sp.]|nr:hypothetical protein [Cellulomonas sp.]